MKPASFTSYEGAELDTMLPCASRQHMCLLRSDGRLKMTHAPLYPGGCAGCPVADGRSCAAEIAAATQEGSQRISCRRMLRYSLPFFDQTLRSAHCHFQGCCKARGPDRASPAGVRCGRPGKVKQGWSSRRVRRLECDGSSPEGHDEHGRSMACRLSPCP